MVAKTETRPRISVDESDLRKLQAFSKEYDLEMDEVYGLALEKFAETIRNGGTDAIAEEINERTETYE